MKHDEEIALRVLLIESGLYFVLVLCMVIVLVRVLFLVVYL